MSIYVSGEEPPNAGEFFDLYLIVSFGMGDFRAGGTREVWGKVYHPPCQGLNRGSGPKEKLFEEIRNIL